MRMAKTSIHLDIDAALLDQAQALGLDLSVALEAEIVRAVGRAKWQEENREAIEAHNRRVERFGLFSDRHRRF
jgi:antitoxin CcdA